MVLRSWRFVPVVGLAVLALSLLLRADRSRSPPGDAQPDVADLAAAFLGTMALLVGVILVMLAAELVTVLH